MNCLACLKELKTGEQGEYHKACLASLLGSSKACAALPFAKSELNIGSLKSATERMSISGVQIKLSLKLSKGVLDKTGTGGRFILKPSPEQYPHIAENEHVSMLIGKLLGVDTPPLALVRFSDGELAYLVKRFDRKGPRKLRKEDMCQLFGVSREEKYTRSYEEVGRKILEATGGDLFCAHDFLKRLAYNYLIANGDFHLKNISLMDSGASTGRPALFDSLSPNYDSVNTRLYIPREAELALSDGLLSDDFTEEYKALGFYSYADFKELGVRLGISPAAIQEIAETARKRERDMFKLIEASFLPPDMKSSYAGIVKEQLKKFLSTLPSK